MVYDITTRLESFSLNTVISGFMEYNNKLNEIAKKAGGVDKETSKHDWQYCLLRLLRIWQKSYGSSSDTKEPYSMRDGRLMMKRR